MSLLIETSNPIKINSKGLHQLSIWTFFYCSLTPNCSTAGDSITINIGSSNSMRQVYKNGSDFGRVQDKGWINEIIPIDITEEEIYVSRYS